MRLVIIIFASCLTIRTTCCESQHPLPFIKATSTQCVVFNLLKRVVCQSILWYIFIDSSLRYIAATHCYPSGSPCLMVLFSSSTSTLPVSSSTDSLLLSMFTRSPVNIWQTDPTLLAVSANYNLFTMVVCSRPTEPFRHSVIRWNVFWRTKSKVTQPDSPRIAVALRGYT